MKELEVKFKITVPRIIIGALIILIVVGAFVLWKLKHPWEVEEYLIFFATLLGVGATVTTAMYEVRAFYITRNGYNAVLAQVELDKKQKAFDIACHWNSQHMKETRKDFRVAVIALGKKAGDELLAELMKPENDLALSIIFGYFEEVALAIQNGLADEDVLYDQLKSAVIQNFNRFDVWITHKQTNVRLSTGPQPSAYCQGKALARSWSHKTGT